MNLGWLVLLSEVMHISSVSFFWTGPHEPQINKSAGVLWLCWLYILNSSWHHGLLSLSLHSSHGLYVYLSLTHAFSLSPSLSLKCLCVKLAQGLSLTSFKLCLTVPRVFLQAFFLIDDDVLYVLHGQVVAEGIEQDVFQLLQGDPLHVELQEDRETWGWFSNRPFFSHIGCPFWLENNRSFVHSCDTTCDSSFSHIK